LDDLQLILTPSFKSAGVMENITAVICEFELILDVVFATLEATGSSGSAVTNKITMPNLCCSVELNLARR
jgi:hypothetical protein